MLTLMILVAATWMGLYIAKRITPPRAAAGGGRRRDRRRPSGLPRGRAQPRRVRVAGRVVQPHGGGAVGQPQPAGALGGRTRGQARRRSSTAGATSRPCSSAWPRACCRWTPSGRIRTWNSAATRLLDIDGHGGGAGRRGRARRAGTRGVRGAARRTALNVQRAARPRLSVTRGGRETPPVGGHVAAPCRRRVAERHGGGVRRRVAAGARAEGGGLARGGAAAGARDQEPADADPAVGRAPAPAFRRRRPRPTRDLVDECATTIIGEVESLKGLVDEFSQFARMPAPRAVPTDLHGVLDDALALYDGLLERGALPPALRAGAAAGLGGPRADAARGAQPGGQRGRGDGPARHDRDRRPRTTPPHSLVNVVVADDGPGIPAGRARQAVPARTTPPRSAAAGWGSPSSGASWPSTADRSTSPTTCRTAPGLRSSCPAEFTIASRFRIAAGSRMLPLPSGRMRRGYAVPFVHCELCIVN